MAQTHAQALEAAAEAWLTSKGVKLVEISDEERNAALRRIERQGDLARRRALRLVALWSLAPIARQQRPELSVRDMADFIEAEGFALEDGYGERTLVSEENSI